MPSVLATFGVLDCYCNLVGWYSLAHGQVLNVCTHLSIPGKDNPFPAHVGSFYGSPALLFARVFGFVRLFDSSMLIGHKVLTCTFLQLFEHVARITAFMFWTFRSNQPSWPWSVRKSLPALARGWTFRAAWYGVILFEFQFRHESGNRYESSQNFWSLHVVVKAFAVKMPSEDQITHSVISNLVWKYCNKGSLIDQRSVKAKKWSYAIRIWRLDYNIITPDLIII